MKDDLLTQNRKVHDEYEVAIQAQHNAFELEIVAQSIYEAKVADEQLKYKDLMKSDPVSIQALIRKDSEAELTALRFAEIESRKAKTDLKRAGSRLDYFRLEIEIIKLSLGEV